MALNNFTAIQSLASCEALRKLDLSVNFIGMGGMASLRHLRQNVELRELHLLGNPCTQWQGYRQWLIATLPHLTSLVSNTPRSTYCKCTELCGASHTLDK